MTKTNMDLSELMAKHDQGDFLRSLAEAVLQLIMETDVEGLIGAGRHERSGERTTWRNGYRERALDTRLGTLNLRVPKLRQGSYFPSFLEARKTSEQALVAVIQEAWIGGVSTRRVDELVQAMGLSGISKSTVVAVKSETQQAAAMAYRTRDLLVRQRTQTINALRAHLAEQGIVSPVGPAHVGRLAAIIEGDDGMLPTAVRELARLLLAQIAGLAEKIASLDAELRRRVTTDDTARRLTTIPGVGAVTAAAITTFAPPMETFSKGRDFAAWIGLTPRQHSSGGKDRLGRTSKMGQRDIRRLLIVGAVAVVRWAARKGAPDGSWLARMLARKPKMLVAVALANRMARTAWALLRKEEDYRDPAMAAA